MIFFSAFGLLASARSTSEPAIAASRSELLSASERNVRESDPMVCATAIFSAILGVTSIVTLE
jgi:hypothetical protein